MDPVWSNFQKSFSYTSLRSELSDQTFSHPETYAKYDTLICMSRPGMSKSQKSVVSIPLLPEVISEHTCCQPDP